MVSTDNIVWKERKETEALLNRMKKMKGFLFKANKGFILFIYIREYYEIKLYTKAWDQLHNTKGKF